MIESMQTSLLEFLASVGDNSLSLLLEATGEIGENFILFLLKSISEINLHNLQDDTKNAAKVQQNLLLEIIRLQQNTNYGKKYDFANIKTPGEFCSKHPFTTYKDYSYIIDNITNTNDFTQLTSEPITLFQETSGTSGEIKLIPRTNRLSWSFMKAFQATEAVAEFYSQRTKTFSEKRPCLALINTLPVKNTPIGIPRGTGTSGSFRQATGKFKLVEKIISLKYTSPTSVFLISEPESAYYCHLLFGLLEDNLTSIAANFAANTLEAMQILEKKWQQLTEDIEYGHICGNIKLNEDTRNELQSLLKPNPERAKLLRAEFEKGFDAVLSRIWPRLSYIQCITTGSMQLYKENLKFYAGAIPFYSGGYGASEAWIGVNLEPEREPPAYVITPHSAFFEFIPEAKIDTDIPIAVDLNSLQVGENYEVVVTTVAGLYRYRIGDIVKCVGYYNQSPIVEFLYRRHSLLNVAGEKVSESVVLAALTEAVKVFGEDCRVIDYTTRVEFSCMPWKYVIYAEFSKSFQGLPNLNVFENEIDKAISNLNELYFTLRKTNNIGFPQIKLVKEGSFKDLKNIIVEASSEAQFKMPRLLNDSKLINFIESKSIVEEK